MSFDSSVVAKGVHGKIDKNPNGFLNRIGDSDRLIPAPRLPPRADTLWCWFEHLRVTGSRPESICSASVALSAVGVGLSSEPTGLATQSRRASGTHQRVGDVKEHPAVAAHAERLARARDRLALGAVVGGGVVIAVDVARAPEAHVAALAPGS